MSRIHVLKVWVEPYNALLAGRKTAEFRKDDRGFVAGDVLHLQPYDPPRPDGTDGGYVNLPSLRAEISHVAKGPHIPEGWAMLSLRGLREATIGEDDAAMRAPGAYGPPKAPQADNGTRCDWCGTNAPRPPRTTWYRTSWGTWCSAACADAEEGCK